jgi:hypothetical protein
MNIAAQVATGNRKRILEDGPDVINSDDDDALEDVKPDEEKGMNTAETDPKQGPVKLTQAQAAYLRAAGQALKASKVPPQTQPPVRGSSDDDDPESPEWVWSQTKSCMRRNKHFKGAATADIPKSTNPSIPRSSTPVGKDPTPLAKAPPRPSTPTVSVPPDPPSPKKSVKKGAGKKAAVRPADQKATQPKSTSRAGSLCPGVGGSGQKDTRVASSHPSKT